MTQIDKHQVKLNRELIKATALSQLSVLLAYLLPRGKQQGKQYVVGDIEGQPGNSLVVELESERAGLWHDFATGEGGDIFDLWAQVFNLDVQQNFAQVMEAMTDYLRIPAESAKYTTPSTSATPSLGKPSCEWHYHNVTGDIIATVKRYDLPDGSKTYRPWDAVKKTFVAPDIRPLYNLPAITQAETVILVEGEKCADAVIQAGLTATTAMQGANAPISKTDWSPLKGKHVVIWPDNDTAGLKYATRAAQAVFNAGAASIAMLKIPSDKPAKWDAADAMANYVDIKAFIKGTQTHWQPTATSENKLSLASTLQGFLERYVYIDEKDSVGDLRKRPDRCIAKLQEFKNITANCLHEVLAPTPWNPNKTRIEPIWRAWLTHQGRKNVQGTCYRPKEERLVHDNDGSSWLNQFYLPPFTHTTDEHLLLTFFEHMEYLFHVAEECKWFIDWMAFNLQYPERRCKVTPMHISLAHGTGRGWLVKLMIKLLGSWNCTKTKMSVLCSDYNGFHDYLNNSLFCAIEEVREGGKRYEISDSIRDLLTEDELEINCKYGTKRTQRVYTNFFLMSNHPDALVLTNEDRRINVFFGPSEPKSNAYYTQLYDWLDTVAVDQLFHHLMRRDLSQFNWQRAFDNEAKADMICNNRTPTEILFWDFMETARSPVMTFAQIKYGMRHLAEDGPAEANIDERQLIKLLQHNCRQSKAVKVLGKRMRPWVLNPRKNFTHEQIRTHLAGHEQSVTTRSWSNNT